MFESISIPSNVSASKKRRFTVEETEQAAALLASTGTVSDGKVYDQPHKKLTPRQVAQYQAWYLRHQLADDGHYELSEVRAVTWADGDGYRWAIKVK